MENGKMGQVVTEATVENLQDLWDVRRGTLGAEKVRRVAVSDALVDTGATTLALPTRLIQQLGLLKVSEKRSKSTHGIGTINCTTP